MAKKQHGQFPGLIELDAGTGEVQVSRAVLPRTAKKVVFGWGLGERWLADAAGQLAAGSPVLVVVGASSSKALAVSRAIARLSRLGGPDWAAGELLEVAGHADHAVIREGITALRRTGAALVVAVGGGTVLDVGKAVAALARLEDGEDVAAFQLGRRKVVTEMAVPWVAVPTTSGTGSESTDNAVIEIGDEKKSIRGIPAADLILADPALTDSLPRRATVIAAIDALAQSLEVLTGDAASVEVQEVALAAFASLADGIERLKGAAAVSHVTRDVLGWGSLLMGIAFAHARLGLPHALVHLCAKFGLVHGNMVGIMLGPGLAVQARDAETARRLARAAVFMPGGAGQKAGGAAEDTALAAALNRWVVESVSGLFSDVGLPAKLAAAGLSRADLDWIIERESAGKPSIGSPARAATVEELREVLEGAYC